jgi:hypothetical protein
MASAGNEHVIRHFEEVAFGTGPVDWAASGTAFLCLEPNFEEVRQESLENANIRHRAYHGFPMVPGRRNGTLSFGLYWHGRGTTAVAAEGANATTFVAADFVRNAWGGRRLGRASGIASATTSVVTMDVGEGAQYRPGDWMFLIDASDSSRGRFVRVGSVAGDDVTCEFDAPVDLDDAGADTSGAVIVGYLHTRAMINRDNADHVTHSFLQCREASDDVIEARGCKLNLTGIESVESGGLPVLQFEGLAATHENEGLTRPADPASGAIEGDSPLVVSQGSDTFISLGDVGGNLSVVEAHAVSITPGVASAPVEGVGGVEGRHGYHGVGFDGTQVEIVVPHSDAYQVEWANRTERHMLLQIGTTQGRAVGLYMPRMVLAQDPSKTTTDDLATTTLVYEAREFEGAELSGLAGEALEQYRSKVQILWSA